jgi:group I intron endonuclease
MVVYLVTNKVNGKRYVGWTSKSLEVRWRQHSRRHSNCFALHNAINKYGVESFTIEVLFTVPTKELATELEIEHIKIYNTISPNGYNLTSGGEGVAGDCEEVRRKKSLANIGNKHAVGAIRTPEYCKAISDRQQGRQFTDIWRQRMSDAAKERVVSQETKNKHSETNKRLGLRPPALTSEQAAEAGRISGHKRYHISRNILNPKCKFCNQ